MSTKKQIIPYSGMLCKAQLHNQTEIYGVDVVSLLSPTNFNINVSVSTESHLMNLQNTRQGEVENSESSSPCCLAAFFVTGRLANRYLAPGRIEAAIERKRTSYNDLFVEGRKPS